jgi:hypothetical protein
MDTATLVDNQLEDGHKLISQLVRNNFDVTASAWICPSEEGRWYLYVVSRTVDEKGLAVAYREAYATLRSLTEISLSVSEVKLIGPANPIAADVLEIQRRHAIARVPIRYHGPQLGRIAIDEAYIYPPPITTWTAEEVVHKILDLMKRRGKLRPSTITLRDGSSVQGIPIGIEVWNNNVAAKILDPSTNSAKLLPVNEITGIL